MGPKADVIILSFKLAGGAQDGPGDLLLGDAAA